MFVIGNLVLQIYFTIIDWQQITQFIYIALLCWTANNSMVLFFRFYVGQWLTQVIFHSVLGSEYCFISFVTWICLLNICFLFCDGVCSTPRNVLLMLLFNLFCWGISIKFWFKISNELCEISQLKKGIMYLKAFVIM